jgi:uncharacterized Zn-binding protein involved in type VI secretion
VRTGVAPGRGDARAAYYDQFMPKNARKNDLAKSDGATCKKFCKKCPHPWMGPIATGAQMINGQLSARVTDTGPTCCPHGGTFRIVKGSGTVSIDGQKVARVGDPVQCIKCGAKGKIIAGSNNTTAG